LNDKIYSPAGGSAEYDIIADGPSIIDKNKKIDEKLIFA
jgi:hypothetical protein